MRRRWGSALILVALATMTVGTMGTRISIALEVRTFADDFSNSGYGGSDGTAPWNGPWKEHPINNGSSKGNITITTSGPDCDGCLSIGEPVALIDSSIDRSVDVAGASAVRLDLRYRIRGEDGETAVVRLRVADATHSRTLATFALSEKQSSMSDASFDVTDFADGAMTVSFEIVGLGLTDGALLVPEIVITAEFGGPSATTTTTAATTTTTMTMTTTTFAPAPTSTTTTVAAPTTSTTTRPSVPTTTNTTTTTRPPAPTTTTTLPPTATTTTTTTAGAAGTDVSATTTTIVLPSETPEYETDKAVLVSSNESVSLMMMQPMEEMAAHNKPEAAPIVTFVNAAESVRSTAVYGLGIGLLLAGFLLAGFGDDEDQPADSGDPGSA